MSLTSDSDHQQPPALANDAIEGGASQLNIVLPDTRTMPTLW
jgi:hypothetical protein